MHAEFVTLLLFLVIDVAHIVLILFWTFSWTRTFDKKKIMDIKGKVAIVTGGAGGIGFATVRELLKHGVKHVAIFDINQSSNLACLNKLNEEFGAGRASTYTCDVTIAGKFTELYNTVIETQKKVDILINSSGVLRDRQPGLTVSVNLTHVIESTLTAIERMGKHNKGEGGVILNVASIAGLMIFPLFPVYLATKHGVVSFTTSLKESYYRTGVRTLVVCPGATITPMVESIPAVRKELFDFIGDELFDKYMEGHVYQPAENVGVAIVKMIQEAETGAIWVSEDNQPPYAIKDLPIYKERRISV